MWKSNQEEKTIQLNYPDDLREEVEKGLSAKPKYLPSRFLYDEKGDELFQKIMALPEYYPTRCEANIFASSKEEILKLINGSHRSFKIIELGAGDGKKTSILLKYFLDQGAVFSYQPIDISSHAIESLTGDLQKKFPGLSVEGLAMEYFEALRVINKNSPEKKLILFLGSSIGNFNKTECVGFLKKLCEQMGSEDHLLVGFDLKKDPGIIEKAYNDSSGVTREFNFNLLERLNRELGADFDLGKFEHCPVYEPVTGEMKSYLVSKEQQSVYIAALNRSFDFEPWETIFTEVSSKYKVQDIVDMSQEAGLTVKKMLFDPKKFYCDVIMTRNISHG